MRRVALCSAEEAFRHRDADAGSYKRMEHEKGKVRRVWETHCLRPYLSKLSLYPKLHCQRQQEGAQRKRKIPRYYTRSNISL